MTSEARKNEILYPTCCAICGTKNDSSELYPANFDFGAFTPEVFSARRIPDGTHYRIVRCNHCGLLRSDPVVTTEMLADLYAESEFTYDEEVINLKRTYGRYLKNVVTEYGAAKGRLLEIGCGNGFFLEEALDQGFANVCGVEPSRSAVGRASERVRDKIICDMMRPGLFPTSQFDVVCMFQVLDHMPQPGQLLDECLKVLKRGGLILSLNHNSQSVSARILRERSPIIDLEHTYLYSPGTMRGIFTAHGFEVLAVRAVRNTYSLRYLLQLLPMPLRIKDKILSFLQGSRFGALSASVPLGNLWLAARKPRT